MRIERPYTVLLLAMLVGCGDEGARPEPPEGPLVLTLAYKGTDEGRPLEQAKLHTLADNYTTASNLLREPLELDESISFVDISAGDYYLTVVRKALDLPGSDRIALTTAEPFSLSKGHVVIWIFDESFRVFDAVAHDGGVPDQGQSDFELDAGFDASPDTIDDATNDAEGDLQPAG